MHYSMVCTDDKKIAGRGTESLPHGTSNGGKGNKSKILGEVLELGQSWILDCSQNPKAVRLYMNHPPGLDLSFANAFVFATYSFGRCSHLYRGFLGQQNHGKRDFWKSRTGVFHWNSLSTQIDWWPGWPWLWILSFWMNYYCPITVRKNIYIYIIHVFIYIHIQIYILYMFWVLVSFRPWNKRIPKQPISISWAPYPPRLHPEDSLQEP